MRKSRYNWYDKQAKLRNFYQQIQKENDVTQVTVTNHTNDIRKITLWGANASPLLTDPMFFNEVINKMVEVKTHPQGITYNPANDSFYVANQLSNSVSVISATGQLITTISLGTSLLPGSISPVAIAINTKIDSINYGMIAVACSVSDEVIIINLNHTINRKINVDTRPISIIHNSIDDCYYVANLVEGSITKISNDYSPSNFLNIENPRSIGVNTDNGELYIHSSKTKTISFFDLQGNLKATGLVATSEIVSFAFHPVNKTMYMALNDSNEVIIINDVTYEVITIVQVGNDPVALSYNLHDDLMYVANRGDQNITRIDINYQIVDNTNFGDFDIGMAISTQDNIIALSNSGNNQVTVVGEHESPTVSVNEEYYEDRVDFQHNPTLIAHLKVVASGNDRVNVLQLLEQTISGKTSCKTISLSSHHSPQNFGNISEVFDIEGNLIDGHSSWCFKINPLQRVTFLIYHKQFEMYNLLPEKSRISTGVQMSKGIPGSWLDNYQNEPNDEPDYKYRT